MLRKKINKFVKRWPIVKSSALLADDLLSGVRMATGQISSNSGATHAKFSEEESVDYIEEVFSDYKKYGLLERFSGVAAEVGPGDNAGVALLMRKDGCTQVDLIDRYFTNRNVEQQTKIYQALERRHALLSFKSQDSWHEQLPGISWKIGHPAELYFQNCAQNQGQIYDYIVSRAVLEHLFNPITALQYMVACLKPGGQMLHKIDLRDHGMFTPEHHELTFLEIPKYFYRLMTHNSGRPNRVLVNHYRKALTEMKDAGLIDYTLLVSSLVNVGNIDPHQLFTDIDKHQQDLALSSVEKHRQNFHKEFSRVSNEDLAISGIFLVITRK